MTKKTIPSDAELRRQMGPLLYSLQHSDLACAIVGASFLDHCLACLLSQHLTEGDTANDLLQPGRPLGEFSARAKFAYSLGLIPASYLKEATKIGEIRNKFAHLLFSTSFDAQEIKTLCDAMPERENVAEPKNNRTKFIAAVSQLSFEILLLASEVPRLTTKSEKDYPNYGKNKD